MDNSLVNNTRICETCFEAGFSVSDFGFRVMKSIAWFRRYLTSNLTLRFITDHALKFYLYETSNEEWFCQEVITTVHHLNISHFYDLIFREIMAIMSLGHELNHA